MKQSAGTLTRMGLICVVLIISSWLTVPFAVPFTLQTLGVFVGIGLLGGRKATVCMLVYLLLGSLGLPVFAGMQGGFGVLLGPTGGYLLGLIPLCLLSGWLWKKAGGFFTKCLALFLGLAVDYIMGALWYWLVYTRGQAGLVATLTVCVLPFVIPDVLKIAVGVTVVQKLKKVIALIDSAIE